MCPSQWTGALSPCHRTRKLSASHFSVEPLTHKMGPDKNFFRVPSFCTRLIGIWPLSPDRLLFKRWTWKSVYRMYLLTALLAVCGCVEVRYLLQDVSELIAVLEALFLSVTILMGVFKIIVALIYRKAIRQLLLKFYDVFQNGKQHRHVWHCCREQNATANDITIRCGSKKCILGQWRHRLWLWLT